jgi:hypothetical protein
MFANKALDYHSHLSFGEIAGHKSFDQSGPYVLSANSPWPILRSKPVAAAFVFLRELPLDPGHHPYIARAAINPEGNTMKLSKGKGGVKTML